MSELNLAAVVDAHNRISGDILRTRLIETRIGDSTVWLKCECEQTGGAFKLRGATNRLLQLDAAERARGVVAFSSGNHARGVAIAARRLAIKATIVMPADAPSVKVEGTRGEGAEIVFYDRRTESREEIAARIAADSGAIVVPSFDDRRIVAGQGTVGLEIVEQLAEAGAPPPDVIAVPCSGGGLSAGIALVVPDATVVAVEPSGWDDMARSMASGEIVTLPADTPDTVCDALQATHVSPITLGVLRAHEAKAVDVSDEEVAEAMRFAWRNHGLTVEPGGSAALAAVLAGKIAVTGTLVVVLSGGNVDPALHARIVGA